MLLWIARDDVRQRTHGAGHSGLRPSHAWRLSYITAFIVPYILSCTFFAITLSSLIYRREDCILIFVFMSVPMVFLSGISWPSSAMPPFWKYFSYIFPSSLGMNAYPRIMSMGYSTAVYRLVGTSTGLLHHILLCLSSSHQKVCIVSGRVRVAALIGIATYVLASTIYNRPIGMVCGVVLNLPRGQAPHVSFGSLAYLMDSA